MDSSQGLEQWESKTPIDFGALGTEALKLLVRHGMTAIGVWLVKMQWVTNEAYESWVQSHFNEIVGYGLVGLSLAWSYARKLKAQSYHWALLHASPRKTDGTQSTPKDVQRMMASVKKPSAFLSLILVVSLLSGGCILTGKDAENTADSLMLHSNTVLESTRSVNRVVRVAYDTKLLSAEDAAYIGKYLKLFNDGHGVIRAELKSGWDRDAKEWRFNLDAVAISRIRAAIIELRNGINAIRTYPKSIPLVDGAAMALLASMDDLVSDVERLKPSKKMTLRFDDDTSTMITLRMREQDAFFAQIVNDLNLTASLAGGGQ